MEVALISKPMDKKENLVTEEIEASFVLVISEEGEQLGKLAIEDAYKRLIKPSIDREIRSDLKDKAENQAILIFMGLCTH